MIDSTDDGTLTTARRLLIHTAVKEVNQNINADKQEALLESLEEKLALLQAKLAARDSQFAFVNNRLAA